MLGDEGKKGNGTNIRAVPKRSKDLRIRDIVVLKKDHQVPAEADILTTISNEVNQAEGGEGTDTPWEILMCTH